MTQSMLAESQQTESQLGIKIALSQQSNKDLDQLLIFTYVKHSLP
jgi:hypothetical protein